MAIWDKMFDMSQLENVGRQLTEFLSSADARMTRIEQNQKLIMEKLGIETPEQRDALTKLAIIQEENKNG